MTAYREENKYNMEPKSILTKLEAFYFVKFKCSPFVS